MSYSMFTPAVIAGAADQIAAEARRRGWRAILPAPLPTRAPRDPAHHARMRLYAPAGHVAPIPRTLAGFQPEPAL